MSRIALTVTLLGLFAATASGSELVVGRSFPTVELPSLADGSRASVKDYRGKKLMLHVWASW